MIFLRNNINVKFMKRVINFYGILFIFSTFILVSCEAEGLYLKPQLTKKKSNVIIKKLKGQEARSAYSLLKKSFANRLTFLNGDDLRTTNDLSSIDYNDVLLIIDSLDLKNYTFKIINHPSDTPYIFHNLVLSQKADNTQEVLLIKYKNDFQSHKISEFRGEVTIKNISISTNPCDNITAPIDFIDVSNPSNGGGGSGDSPINNPITFFPSNGSGGGGGIVTVSDMPYFLCSSPGCHFTSNSWAGYSAHTYTANGNTYIYPFTMVFRFSQSDSSVSVDPCSPEGSIGVLEPDDPCKTSKDKLKLVFPNTPDDILEEIATNINEYGKDFGIDSKEKLQHFLSQAGHESTNYAGVKFGTFSENLNYRIVNLGVSAFERYFNPVSNPTAVSNKANPNDYVNPANPIYAKKEMLANYVYNDANRLEGYKLGNINVGDGYKYRGRGIIQLTGRTNYNNFNEFYSNTYDNTVNIIDNPELVSSDYKIAVISALWFFKNNVIDVLSNGIDENTTAKKVTKLVNGKYKGLADRSALFESAKINIDCL